LKKAQGHSILGRLHVISSEPKHDLAI